MEMELPELESLKINSYHEQIDAIFEENVRS